MTCRRLPIASCSCAPLYGIDGFPIENDIEGSSPGSGGRARTTPPNPLATLNPGDLESISILEDASSTAIYGARGAVERVRVLGTSAEASVVEVTGKGGLRWTVMVTNGPASATARRAVTFGGRTYAWTGDFAVEGLQTP